MDKPAKSKPKWSEMRVKIRALVRESNIAELKDKVRGRQAREIAHEVNQHG